MGTVVTVTNHKGGVGKTTTVINLAAVLSKYCRVLVVDCDPQANATIGIQSTHPRDLAPTLFHVMREGSREVTLQSIIPNVADTGVSLIPGDIRLSLVERELRANAMDPVRRLASVLEFVRNDYDIIFIDTPPSLGLLTTNALVASDRYIVPFLSGDVYGLYGADSLLDHIAEIREIKPTLELAGALLIMHDSRHGVCKMTLDEVSKTFSRVFETTIRPATLIKKASALRMSVMEAEKSAKVSKDYRGVAMELLEVIGMSGFAQKKAKPKLATSEVR